MSWAPQVNARERELQHQKASASKNFFHCPARQPNQIHSAPKVSGIYVRPLWALILPCWVHHPLKVVCALHRTKPLLIMADSSDLETLQALYTDLNALSPLELSPQLIERVGIQLDASLQDFRNLLHINPRNEQSRKSLATGNLAPAHPSP